LLPVYGGVLPDGLPAVYLSPGPGMRADSRAHSGGPGAPLVESGSCNPARGSVERALAVRRLAATFGRRARHLSDRARHRDGLAPCVATLTRPLDQSGGVLRFSGISDMAGSDRYQSVGFACPMGGTSRRR